jgi:hypothetical protein
MLITLVEHRTDSAALVYAYLPSGQFFGNGGTVADWQRWIAANRPEWPAPVVAEKPPSVLGSPPEHGEKCSLCGRGQARRVVVPDQRDRAQRVRACRVR